MKKTVNGAGYALSLEDVKGRVGMGWGPLVEDLVKDLFSLGWNGEVSQVKEKFGALRFYIGGGSHALLKRIDQAELLSSTICDMCGKEGKNSSWGGYWVCTLCPEHGEEREKEIEGRKKKP
jgi:hypothetical protein